MAPVDVYAALQNEGTRLPQSYGDHRIADPMAWIRPEERTNMLEQLVLDSDMVQVAKAPRKVVIEKFDSTKLQWS